MTFPICPVCVEFSSLLIRQLTDLLQIENKSANNAPRGKCKRAFEQKKSLRFKIRYASCCRPQVEARWRYREWKRRHKGCNNKNQARNEFAQSAGNYLHVYTKLKQQTITSRVFPFASARWQRYMYTAKSKKFKSFGATLQIKNL